MSIMLIQTPSTIMGLNAQRMRAKHPTKMVMPRLSCTIILLHDPTSSNSFVLPNGSGYRQKRVLLSTPILVKGMTTNSNVKNNNSNVFSESANNPTKTKKKITKDNIINNNLVVVNRNKQSLEFKKGIPLIFSGAMSHAIEKNLNINDIDNNGLKKTSSSSSTLPTCSLVCLLVPREDNDNDKNNKSKKCSKSKKSTACLHYKISDVNDNIANADLKSLQIAAHGVCNPSCHESVHLCRKLQKESADCNREIKKEI